MWVCAERVHYRIPKNNWKSFRSDCRLKFSFLYEFFISHKMGKWRNVFKKNKQTKNHEEGKQIAFATHTNFFRKRLQRYFLRWKISTSRWKNDIKMLCYNRKTFITWANCWEKILNTKKLICFSKIFRIFWIFTPILSD